MKSLSYALVFDWQESGYDAYKAHQREHRRTRMSEVTVTQATTQSHYPRSMGLSMRLISLLPHE